MPSVTERVYPDEMRENLGHPHHFFRRLYQIIFGGGVLFEDQECLLTKA